MKTPSKQLWLLIQRMTPAEKRYFKTHFGVRPNRLVQLFDVLNRQDEYDEAAAQAALGIAPTQYKVVKAQLNQLVVRSLIAGNKQPGVSSKIRLGLEEVEIYVRKELFAEAQQLLLKLLRWSQQYGLTLYQYEITERLHNISFLELDSTDSKAAEHQEKLDRLSNILAQRQELSQIRLQLEEWNPFNRERQQQLQPLEERLRKTPAENLDLPGSLSWLINTSLCFEAQGKYEEAKQYRDLAFEFFVQNKTLQRELPFIYLRVLKSRATQTGSHPDRQVINALSEAAQQVIRQHPQYSPHFIYFLWARLRAYFLNHQWQDIVDELEQPCLDHLEQYQLQHYRTAANIFLVLANAHLVLEHPQLVQHYIRRFRTNRMNVDLYLSYTVNLIELISHWETQDYDLITRRVLAFQRALQKEKRPTTSQLYQLHLQLFGQLAQTPFRSTELAADLLLQFPDYQNDPMFNYYTSQNLERWLQAVAARRPLADVLQKR